MNKYAFLYLIYHFSPLNCMQLTIDNLSLNQKIGQLFMVAAVADEELAKDCINSKPYRMDKDYIEDLITDYHIGGIIYLGKSKAKKQLARTCHFQSISQIPLLVGQDLEPGKVGGSRLPDSFNFSSNKALGKINNLEYTQEIGNIIGNMCKQLGVHMNFAPVADINNNPANPVINNRSFSNRPEIVAEHAIAFAKGLQETTIIACAKHFPGHGDTDSDSHHDLPVIAHNKKRLNKVELYPFKELIKAEIPAIMIGHLVVPALEEVENLPATLSKTIITDFLKNTLGFKGLIITDALDMGAITNTYSNGQAELLSLLAGNDILLCPVDVPAAFAAIKQAIADQIITEDEIDAHVAKIITLKHTLFNF
jgi:beta-N-acetylhexosaminidase